MKSVVLSANWKPKEGFKPGSREIIGKRSQQGNLVWHTPKAKVINKPVPKLGSMEVLIKINAAGICGSDILMSWPDDNGYSRYPYIMADGVTIGHEVSGVITKMGEGVKKHQEKSGSKALAIGTPVAVQCVAYCGYCNMCKQGLFDSCLLNEEIGFSMDGGMATYMKADIRYVHSIQQLEEKHKKNLFLAGALLEPLSGVYKAIVEVGGGIKSGETAVVIGGGPIGLSAAALFNSLQASNVILFDLFKERRDIAKAMGATHAYDPLKVDFKEKILDLTGGEGAAMYFEAAGIASKIYPKIEDLLQTGTPESKFVVMGHGPDKMQVSHEVLISGYHRLTGSHGHCGVWPRVISLVASKTIDPTKMIGKKIKLDDVPKWLDILRTDKSISKVMVTQFE